MLRQCWFNLAYLRHPVWDTGISPSELIEFINTHPAGRALDMGCGTGTNVITLAKHGWEVTGVDFTRRAIRMARHKAQQNQVEVDLIVDDVSRLEGISGPFDLILDMGCFHSLAPGKRPAYIANIDRLLDDHGTFLLYTFIKSNPESIGPGSTEAGLQLINRRLEIVGRSDGTERGIRPSAWLAIKKRL